MILSYLTGLNWRGRSETLGNPETRDYLNVLGFKKLETLEDINSSQVVICALPEDARSAGRFTSHGRFEKPSFVVFEGPIIASLSLPKEIKEGTTISLNAQGVKARAYKILKDKTIVPAEEFVGREKPYYVRMMDVFGLPEGESLGVLLKTPKDKV